MTCLCATVDDVDLMQRDNMDNLLAFLQFPLRTLHEPRRRSCAHAVLLSSHTAGWAIAACCCIGSFVRRRPCVSCC